jgi:hypothetical protein
MRPSLTEPSLVNVAHHHRRALFDAAPRDGEADPGAGGSGDEHGLAFEQAMTRRIGRAHLFWRSLDGHRRGSRGSPRARSAMMLR